MITRRAFLGHATAVATAGPSLFSSVAQAADTAIPVKISREVIGPVSPYIYGSNEIGVLDKSGSSSSYDGPAGVTARRLGGNLLTTYNWVNNAANAGKDWHHANLGFLADMLQMPAERQAKPGSIIEWMHDTSLNLGAISLVTVPIAGYVAADMKGDVSEAEKAPSMRFRPVVWDSAAKADDPVDERICDVAQLLRKLVARYGAASTATGIRAYALDNEPGLWNETHPRLWPNKPSIALLIERSIKAAKVIKSIDPAAWVFGPASWGVTEFVSFTQAPDWPKYQHYGSFLAAYLDAFQKASNDAGIRLLDALDVHWYAYNNAGEILHTQDPKFEPAILNAPRSLTERGYKEESWVSRALPLNDVDPVVSLPVLPSLKRIIAAYYPGTELAVTEYNFGGANLLASGLAIADVLGRFGEQGIGWASHWGNLEGWIGEAFKLYRNYDGQGGRYGKQALKVEAGRPEALSVFASKSASGPHIVAINRSTSELNLDFTIDSATGATLTAYGFDASLKTGTALEPVQSRNGLWTVKLPPLSARHFAMG